MSQSSDDPRRQRPPGQHPYPGPTQRTPPARPHAPRPDVAPPPPRARPIDWDDTNYDPYTVPPARRVQPDDTSGYSLEFEPSPLRASRPQMRDIEPPLDEPPLEDAWRQVMTQPPAHTYRQPDPPETYREHETQAPELQPHDPRLHEPRPHDARAHEPPPRPAPLTARPPLSAPSLDDELIAHAPGEKAEKAKDRKSVV